MSATATHNIIDLQKAGNRALKTALGHDGAQAFLKLCRGNGDFTKERREHPEPAHEEVVAGMTRLQNGHAEKLAGMGVRIVPMQA